MGYTDLTQHGFRSTFSDWAGETTNYPREVIEHALAHQLLQIRQKLRINVGRYGLSGWR